MGYDHHSCDSYYISVVLVSPHYNRTIEFPIEKEDLCHYVIHGDHFGNKMHEVALLEALKAEVRSTPKPEPKPEVVEPKPLPSTYSVDMNSTWLYGFV